MGTQGNSRYDYRTPWCQIHTRGDPKEIEDLPRAIADVKAALKLSTALDQADVKASLEAELLELKHESEIRRLNQAIKDNEAELVVANQKQASGLEEAASYFKRAKELTTEDTDEYDFVKNIYNDFATSAQKKASNLLRAEQ